MKMSVEFGAMIRMEETPRIWGKTVPVQLRPLENIQMKMSVEFGAMIRMEETP